MAEIYGFFFGKWNKCYRQRRNGPNRVSPNYVSSNEAFLFLWKVLVEEFNAPCPALPKPENIARAANRLRQQLRPEDPRDLNFSVEEDAFPAGFYKGEVKVKERRHLIFATDQQLTQLAASKSWYVDK